MTFPRQTTELQNIRELVGCIQPNSFMEWKQRRRVQLAQNLWATATLIPYQQLPLTDAHIQSWQRKLQTIMPRLIDFSEIFIATECKVVSNPCRPLPVDWTSFYIISFQEFKLAFSNFVLWFKYMYSSSQHQFLLLCVCAVVAYGKFQVDFKQIPVHEGFVGTCSPETALHFPNRVRFYPMSPTYSVSRFYRTMAVLVGMRMNFLALVGVQVLMAPSHTLLRCRQFPIPWLLPFLFGFIFRWLPSSE